MHINILCWVGSSVCYSFYLLRKLTVSRLFAMHHDYIHLLSTTRYLPPLTLAGSFLHSVSSPPSLFLSSLPFPTHPCLFLLRLIPFTWEESYCWLVVHKTGPHHISPHPSGPTVLPAVFSHASWASVGRAYIHHLGRVFTSHLFSAVMGPCFKITLTKPRAALVYAYKYTYLEGSLATSA